jgi:NodT family efflux transporter outer membrane factor (OMF) lipoprotein
VNSLFSRSSHRRPLRQISLALSLLLLITTGCSALRSEYQRPALEVPSHWQQAAVGQPQPEIWWQAFADPQLDALIDQVLQRNNDLAVAGIKLQKARLQANLTATNRTPDLAVSASSQSSRVLSSGNNSTLSHSVEATVSYELDLWGRLASSRDAARWEAEATAQDQAATALSLVGTTAQIYWQIAYLNQSLSLGEASLQDTRRALALAQIKHQAGAIDGMDLLQAEQDLATQEASLTQTRQQLEAQRNGLAILFNAPPEQRQIERNTLHGLTIPQPQAGLPAELLARRPDLQASELRLRSTLASGDNTRLSLYPVLTLTGSAGGQSSDLSRVLRDPVGTLGAGLTLPFVNWEQQQLNVQIADADYAQAVVVFRQSLYQALSDVETALSARQHDQQQAKQLQLAFTLAQRSEQLAEVRYRQGATGVQEWLDEQKKRRTAELALAENQLNQLNHQMVLLQALGGSQSPYTR